MKRRWETPKTIVDEFEANEYVAVCWGVACYIDEANEYERSIHNSAQDHRSEYCGTTGHQWLTDSNNDGTPERMSEIGTDGLGTWKQVDTASDLEEIVEKILQEFEVDGEIARRDVYGFLRELYIRGIVEDIPEFAGDQKA